MTDARYASARRRADDRAVDAALGLCAGLLLTRTGKGFMEILNPRERAADGVHRDDDRPLLGHPRVLFDRERNAASAGETRYACCSPVRPSNPFATICPRSLISRPST